MDPGWGGAEFPTGAGPMPPPLHPAGAVAENPELKITAIGNVNSSKHFGIVILTRAY